MTKTTEMTNIIEWGSVIAMADTPNSNGRVYTSSALKRAVKEVKERGGLTGMIGMPENTAKELPLDEISHMITHIDFENNQVIAKARTLSTPKGRELSQLLTDNPHAYTLAMTVIVNDWEEPSENNGNVHIIKDCNLTSVNVVPANVASTW